MKAREATYVTSAVSEQGYPPPGPPEIAFVGRSNVGKSSLINSVVGVSGLARTSSTPGRTRLLSWFRVVAPFGKELAFVDLPGYGYAKVPREMRTSWQPLVEGYLSSRETLRLVVVILAARRGGEADDADLLEWLDSLGKRAQVVVTKVDKLSKSKRLPVAMAVKKEMELSIAPLLFSSTTGDGVDDLWRTIRVAIESR